MAFKQVCISLLVAVICCSVVTEICAQAQVPNNPFDLLETVLGDLENLPDNLPDQAEGFFECPFAPLKN